MSPFSRLGAQLLKTRAFVRAPIPLYRHGFGWLLGSRIIMLEHTGRNSGLPRYVCLEVVERDEAKSVTVVSGFGERAQWYHNLQEQPVCYVSAGRVRRISATAVLLGREDSAAALARYQRAHPRSWSHLKATIEQATGEGVDVLPMVQLILDR